MAAASASPGGRAGGADLHYWAREYVAALAQLPQIAKRHCFRRRTLQEELDEAMLRGGLRKAFGGLDVLMLGCGIVIGSGWAQLMGTSALYAGPAVTVSVLISGLAALLAAACYGELTVEYPLSGGAFSYVMVTFGEATAFLALSGLLLEYAVGMGVVARGFSNNLARLCNQGPAFFRVGAPTAAGGQLDLMAAAIVLIITAVLALGVRESAFFISGTTMAKLALLVMIPIVGFTAGSWSNMSPFLSPIYETDGMFLGSAMLFFLQAGFDSLGTTAEEVKDVRHIPWALLGTIGISTFLYAMLALSLVLMTCPNAACPAVGFFSSLWKLSFVMAFTANGMKWMQYVVSVAALLGTVTSITVGLFSISRIAMTASRDWLLPPFLARISPRTQTPVFAQLTLGAVVAVIGMVVPTDNATPMVSFGTLLALFLVCNAQLYRRYLPEGQLRATRHGTIELVDSPSGKHEPPTPDAAAVAAPAKQRGCWVRRLQAYRQQLSPGARKALVWGHLLVINALCIGLAAYYQGTGIDIADVPLAQKDAEAAAQQQPSPPPPPGSAPACVAASPAACDANHEDQHHGLGPVWFLLAWALATLSFQFWCPLEYTPPGFHVPSWLMPWLPSLALQLLVFSVAALPNADFWYLGAFFGAALLFYLLFSLPMSYIKHSRLDPQQGDDINIVELTFADGRWQPVQQALSLPSPLSSLAITGSLAHLPSLPMGHMDPRFSGTFSQRASAAVPSISSSSGGGSFTRQHSSRGQPHWPPPPPAAGAATAVAAAAAQPAQHVQHAPRQTSPRLGGRVYPMLPSTDEGDEGGSSRSTS
ncbi:hypothetical protein ABPG75_006945 [Micractinium tetrahymenae]